MILAAVLLCAGEAPAPTSGAAAAERAHTGAPGADEACRAERAHADADAPEAGDAVAGGKLLLSKRLKLIIRYHQVIPA